MSFKVIIISQSQNKPVKLTIVSIIIHFTPFIKHCFFSHRTFLSVNLPINKKFWTPRWRKIKYMVNLLYIPISSHFLRAKIFVLSDPFIIIFRLFPFRFSLSFQHDELPIFSTRKLKVYLLNRLVREHMYPKILVIPNYLHIFIQRLRYRKSTTCSRLYKERLLNPSFSFQN